MLLAALAAAGPGQPSPAARELATGSAPAPAARKMATGSAPTSADAGSRAGELAAGSAPAPAQAEPGALEPRAFLPAALLPPAHDPPMLGARAVTTASGLRYEDVVTGTGAEAVAGTRATVHFAAYLEDGRFVDDSRARAMAFGFRLGSGMVIAGFDEGVTGMRVGGRRHLLVPPELAYGERGHPPLIPPNAVMRFAVELLAVERDEP